MRCVRSGDRPTQRDVRLREGERIALFRSPLSSLTAWRLRYTCLLFCFLCALQKLRFPRKGDPASTAVLEEDIGDGGGGLLARPIALPFGEHGQPRNRHRT